MCGGGDSIRERGCDGGKYPHGEADMENTLDREPAVRERTELGIVACP